jgi:mannose-6-phosphate isomerase-like protein (cupin superfamily)
LAAPFDILELVMDGQNVPAPPKLLVTTAEARLKPNDVGRATALLLAHGTMELRWFAPKQGDPQTPHDRDELYIVVSGTGVFMCGVESLPFDDMSLPMLGEDCVRFGPGDALFVPAGTVHRFENVSDDFATWVIFYGPEGGERE